MGDLAFLDESGIETREQFAKVIAKSLMEARLAVVFADDTYFDRSYCRWEWSLILRARGTDHVYVTVAAGSTYALDALPPDLRTRNWSTPDLPAALQAHLRKDPPPIGSLITEQDRDYQEHPITIRSAFNLFITLLDSKDEKAAKHVLTAHLLPLLQRDPATLSADLREIQSWMQRRSEPRP